MDVRAARRGASPVRAHYPGGNVRGRQTPSGARPNRGAMTWPASLPGRLLEAVGNHGPRGMTVAGRKHRTEPGLQTGFANPPHSASPRRSHPEAEDASRRPRRVSTSTGCRRRGRARSRDGRIALPVGRPVPDSGGRSVRGPSATVLGPRSVTPVGKHGVGRTVRSPVFHVSRMNGASQYVAVTGPGT